MEVVLFSGGYDSTVLYRFLHWKGRKPKKYFCLLQDSTLSAINMAEYAKVIDYDFRGRIEVPTRKPLHDAYIPSRNTQLVLNCISKIYPQKANIYIGLIDTFEKYSDTTKEWLDAINSLLEVEYGDMYKVYAPFIGKTKDEVYKIGCSLGVKLEDTVSCNFYKDGIPCGECGDCKWRASKKYKIYQSKEGLE